MRSRICDDGHGGTDLLSGLGYSGLYFYLRCPEPAGGVPAASCGGRRGVLPCRAGLGGSGGYINAPGGAAFFWLFVVLPLPMYRLLVQQKDEVRLSVFSWTVTVTVFAAFGLATRNAAYIPFLLLSALAAVIMLTGYSIDIRKSWGVPFRWFGRFAAAASLLISCMPVSWYGVADIQGFHWTTMTILFLLFLLIIALLARGVKTRLWGPVIYSFIPFILLGETLIVRSGLYSSVPLIISAAYMIFLGFYEIMQGVKGGHVNHTRFGTVMLACLMLVFVFATTFSPVVPLVVMAILGLVFFQRRPHGVQPEKRRTAGRPPLPRKAYGGDGAPGDGSGEN